MRKLLVTAALPLILFGAGCSSHESTTPTTTTVTVTGRPGPTMSAPQPSPNSAPAPSSTTSASEGGDQASAEEAIRAGYVNKVADCSATRDAVTDVQSITWEPPGFSQNAGGSGTIGDANPDLGGQFVANYVDGHWDIKYNWC